MKIISLFRKVSKPLFIIIFLILHCLILNNFILLSKDMIYGDFSGLDLNPLPRYGFMRVPENHFTLKYESVNRLAADFSQIYFPSQKFSSLTTAYTKETLDPWQRPSRYAPFIHAMCSISLCKFEYGFASFLHMLVQMLLFFLSFIYAFKILQIEKDLFPSILLVNFCLFLTPVGLSWFERGQFSLYVSLSYLWLVLGLVNRNGYYIFLSALFAYVKWTSFPFIFLVLVLWLLNSKSIKELKYSIYLALVFLLTVVFFFLLYLEYGIHFLVGLFEQEIAYEPQGLSLMKLFPRFIVKTLPFMLVVLGYLNIRRCKNKFLFLIPYFMGSGIILTIYPTLAYDYSIPCLFCFIPLVIYWAKCFKLDEHSIGRLIKYLFFFFVIIASFSINIIEVFSSELTIIYGYILFAAVFILLPLLNLSAKNEEGRFNALAN
ncbi:MAG: hypothetical protein VCF25_11890 [Candidatus Poribacteria bacterium]